MSKRQKLIVVVVAAFVLSSMVGASYAICNTDDGIDGACVTEKIVAPFVMGIIVGGVMGK